MKRSFPPTLLAFALLLTGCANIDSSRVLKQQTTDDLRERLARNEVKQPVVATSPGAWLAGPSIQLAEPMHPALQQKFAYHPTHAISLAELTSWITQRTGIPIDISELAAPTGQNVQVFPGQPSNPVSPLQAQMYAPGYPGSASNGLAANRESMWSMYLNYEGTLAGLLDVAANKSGTWWRMASGRVVFYKTLSKTFYLPVIARKFNASATITTASGNSNSAGGAAGQSTLSSTSGTSADSVYSVDLWGDIEKTAKIVAGGAQIAANPSSGSITVTGTPAQVRQIEEWVKSLGDQLSQQVAITIRIFSVKVTSADNYNWNPNVIFKSIGGVATATLSAAGGPVIASGMTAARLGLGIASPNESFDGSQAALQALSTIGEATETSNQTVVTLNGQPVPLQMANTQGFIESVSTTATTNAGTTSSATQGTVTTGMTGIFLPRIANGKVVLGMTLTRSTNNGFTAIPSGNMTIQTKNVDSDTFQQSVSLTPGDALMLTGISRDTGSTNKSGVGSPNNPLFGGGLANARGQTLTGIVISARIL